MEKACIETYMSKETSEALGLTGHRLHIIETEKQFKIGDWTAMGFPTEHDAAGSLGFLLQKGDIKCLYLVDSLFCRYSFKGLTHALISANYDSDILRDNVSKGLINPNLANRILANHMSIQSVKQFFLDNDMSQLQQVWLLHLSDTNSDAAMFKKEIQAITGKPVFIGGLNG